MFINETGVIAGVLEIATNNVSGSLFLSLFIIFMVLFLICLALRIPLEFAILLMLPLVIVLAAYSSDWTPVLGLFLIMTAVFFARNWFVQPQ